MAGSIWHVVALTATLAGILFLVLLIRDSNWGSRLREHRFPTKALKASLKPHMPRTKVREILTVLLSDVSIEDYCADREFSQQVNAALDAVSRSITVAPSQEIVTATKLPERAKPAKWELTVDTALQCIQNNRIAAGFSAIRDFVRMRLRHVSGDGGDKAALAILYEEWRISPAAFQALSDVLSWDDITSLFADTPINQAVSTVRTLTPHLADLDNAVHMYATRS